MKTIKFLVSFLCILVFSANAKDVVDINAGQKMLIGKSITYFIDTTDKLGIHEVQDKPFLTSKTEILNFGNMPHNVWMSFTVKSETERELYLQLATPLLSEIELYEKNDTGFANVFSGGFNEPFNKRPIALEGWTFNLKLDSAKPVTYFIKGKTLFPFQAPVSVGEKNQFLEEVQQHNLFWGAYMGIMIFAFIYNLFLFLSLKDRAYLFYLLYIVGSSSFYLGLEGYNYEFLWPNMPKLNQYIPVIICVTNIIITLFTLRFLNITKKQKYQYYFGIAFMTIFGLIALITFTGAYDVALGLAQLFSLFISIYLITIGFLSLKRKVPNARFFLIGWVAFLALVILYLLGINNVVPANFFTTHCIFIGHVSEVLLLSFALADRINWLKRENEEKQREIIHYLRQNEEIQLKANAELEKKVQERTAELIENQNKLLESEKMATIGVLASRMAHEIQNPLNFVNNFSEVTMELVDEVEEQITGDELNEHVGMLKLNLQKINQYGKQASNIISVLNQHLREGTAADYFYNDKK